MNRMPHRRGSWWSSYFSLGAWPMFGLIPEFQYTCNAEVENAVSLIAINASNQFRGSVQEIIRGPVLSEVDVITAAGLVTSVITSRSIDALNIRVGDEVTVVFKATEVMLAKLQALS